MIHNRSEEPSSTMRTRDEGKSRRTLRVVEESDLNCSSLNLLCFLRGKDCKASFNRMKKENAKHRVLPITDLTHSTNTKIQYLDRDEKVRGNNRMNPILRMKELVNTTTVARGERRHTKKVLHSKSKAGLKSTPGKEESPKSSMKWGTDSSMYSAISNEMEFTSRDEFIGLGGNWITTDSEYVVLEL